MRYLPTSARWFFAKLTPFRRRAIPQYVFDWTIHPLLTGTIYREIRAVAVRFSKSKELTIRYYLERQPTGYDYESIDLLVTEILAHTSSEDDVRHFRREAVYFGGPMSEMDPLDLMIYTRRED